jgi:hypothetical protein
MNFIARAFSVASTARLNGFLALQSRPEWKIGIVRDVSYWVGSTNWLQIRIDGTAGDSSDSRVRTLICTDPDDPDRREFDRCRILLDLECRSSSSRVDGDFSTNELISGWRTRVLRGQSCDVSFDAPKSTVTRAWEASRTPTRAELDRLPAEVEALRRSLTSGDQNRLQETFAVCLEDQVRLSRCSIEEAWRNTGIPFMLHGNGTWLGGSHEENAILSEPTGRVWWAETQARRSPLRRRSAAANVVSQLHVAWCMHEGRWTPLI